MGTCTATFLVITGMVIKKMISSTSMMSTSGVVLISDMMPRSSPAPDCMLIAIAGNSRKVRCGAGAGQAATRAPLTR